MQVRFRRALTTTAVALAVSAAALPTAASTAADPATASGATDIAASQRPAVVVDTDRRGPNVSPLVFGSNHRFPYAGYGMWNTRTEKPVPEVVAGARRAGIRLLRYPGGARAAMFDWKEAIGPVTKRDCQVFGRWGLNGGVRALYGVDEHMEFAAKIGAETVMTMPIVNETTADAAGWVEYMNTPVGRNPNGGTAWARVRADNGHPHPYGVRRWTVGNEPYLRNQRQWMSQQDSVALRQYVNGGRRTFQSQRVGNKCALSRSGRAQQQQREILYPPVSTSAPVRVTVNGRGWRRVGDFSGVGPEAHVYVLNFRRGKLTFGNGTHGARLPAQARVRASYTSVHPGYVDMARAMKHVDPRISVCSEWGRPDFVAYMGNRKYDCLAAHPYRIVTGTFANRLDAHDTLMASERKATGIIKVLRNSLRRHGHANTRVAVTEFGAISVPAQPHAPRWDLGLSAALFKASQLVHMVNRGMPWATGGALTSHSLRSTLGTKPGFISSAWAVVGRALSPALRAGNGVVSSSVLRGPVRQLDKGSYRALATLSVRDGNRLWLVVVNRDPTRGVRAQLRLPTQGRSGYANKTVVSAPHLWSYNSPAHPRVVHASTARVRLEGTRPVVKYRAHSVTVLRLRLR